VKRAILVGIDDYPTIGPLNGCVNDATALSAMLSTNADGSPNWDTELVTSDAGLEITRDLLRNKLAKLFTNSKGADLLFFFAGHGGQTQDASEYSLGVSMDDLINLANSSPANSVTLLLDCCFSGDVGNTPALQSAGVAETFRLNKAVLRENVTVLAASRATETSEEVDGQGAFTRILLDGLAGGATDHRGNITALSLYAFISPTFDAFQQRPVLKAHVVDPVVLRVGPPWLDPDLLRRLPEHFPTADHRLQLTPAHEGDGRPLPPGTEGTSEQQEFDYAGRLRNANLVTTDDRRDHYWVALESGYVYLTPLGRYFWDLAKRRRL
jgi:hypothetical protein